MPEKKWVRVSTGGKITLPKAIRDQMDIIPGDDLLMEHLDDCSIVLRRNPKTWLSELFKPIREEVKARGITRTDIDRWCKEARRELASERLTREDCAQAPTDNG